MKYKYKFSTLIKVVLVLLFLVAICCLTLNLLQFIKAQKANIDLGVYKTLSISLCVILSLFALVLVPFVFFNSYYKITTETLKINFGFFADKYKLSSIEKITSDKKENKLFITFDNGLNLNILIDKLSVNEFVAEFLQKNKKSEYIEK